MLTTNKAAVIVVSAATVHHSHRHRSGTTPTSSPNAKPLGASFMTPDKNWFLFLKIHWARHN